MNRYLIYFIFIFGTNCFGFLNWNVFSIGRNSIGFFIITILTFIAIYRTIKFKGKSISTSLLSQPITFFLLFIIFQIIRNLAEGVNVKDVFSGFSTISPLLFFFPFVYYFNSIRKLKILLSFVLIVGLLSSIIAIFQYFTGIQFIGSSVTEFEIGSRIYHPGGLLMVICLCLLLSCYLINGFKIKNKIIYLYAPFYIAGIVFTFHCSLIISLLSGFVLIFLFYILFGYRYLKTTKLLSIVVIAIAMTGIIASSSLANALFSRFEEGKENISKNEGNYAFRFEIIGKTFIAIQNKSPLIGQGFNYNSDMSLFDPLGLTADADYGNVVVVFGFLGLALWIFMYIHLFYITIRLYINSTNPFLKTLLLGIIPVPIIFIMLGFFGQIMHYPPNAIVLSTTMGIVYSLRMIINENSKRNEISSIASSKRIKYNNGKV